VLVCLDGLAKKRLNQWNLRSSYILLIFYVTMKKLSGVAIWLIVFLIVGGISIFQEYFSEHTYYYDMLKNWDNRLLMLWWVVSAGIPLGYNYFMDRKATTKWLVWSTIAGILFFAYAFIAVRDEFIWSAFIALPLNISLMIGSAWLMLWGMWSGGAMLYRKLYHHEADTLDRSVTALILWFVAALVISWILVVTTLLYQIVAVACIAVCGYLIWRETQFWKTLARNTSDLINNHLWFDTFSKGLTTILLGITIMYLCYGIMLAFIPYPTAWDANHAYMYIPKIWAEHHGYCGMVSVWICVQICGLTDTTWYLGSDDEFPLSSISSDDHDMVNYETCNPLCGSIR
jgi:hypothetical protein